MFVPFLAPTAGGAHRPTGHSVRNGRSRRGRRASVGVRARFVRAPAAGAGPERKRSFSEGRTSGVPKTPMGSEGGDLG